MKVPANYELTDLKDCGHNIIRCKLKVMNTQGEMVQCGHQIRNASNPAPHVCFPGCSPLNEVKSFIKKETALLIGRSDLPLSFAEE